MMTSKEATRAKQALEKKTKGFTPDDRKELNDALFAAFMVEMSG